MRALDPLFETHRSDLHRLAYRMLGSLTDADDVLQEAYLRWMRESRTAVDSSKAYLYTVVTRLCLDQQRARQTRREHYVGPWLPEPLVEACQPEGIARLEAADSVSLAFLLILENLSASERAAFLLRRVFDYEYADISKILDKSEASCRQLVSRAEARIQARKPRHTADPVQAARLAQEFLNACATGDLASLIRLLAPDAVLTTDGGGKAPAALAPIRGADRVARFFLGVVKKYSSEVRAEQVQVNGRPGFLIIIQGRIDSVLTFDIADGRIQDVFSIRNPDKLGRVVPFDASRG